MITFEISDKEINRVQSELLGMNERQARRFKHRVTGRFKTRSAGKILKDSIRSEFTIKAGKVYDKLSVYTVPGSTWTFGVKVFAKSRQKGSENWKTSPRSTKPSRRIGAMKAEYRKGNPVTYTGIFTGLAGGNNQDGVRFFYTRKPGIKRLPIQRKVGPSLFVMYVNDKVKESAERAYDEAFVKTAIEAIEYEIKKMEGKIK